MGPGGTWGRLTSTGNCQKMEKSRRWFIMCAAHCMMGSSVQVGRVFSSTLALFIASDMFHFLTDTMKTAHLALCLQPPPENLVLGLINTEKKCFVVAANGFFFFFKKELKNKSTGSEVLGEGGASLDCLSLTRVMYRCLCDITKGQFSEAVFVFAHSLCHQAKQPKEVCVYIFRSLTGMHHVRGQW